MVLIKEYRVVLPCSVEEYQVGQLFSVAEASKNETGGGEGIEVLKNEPYEKDGEKGHKVPGFVQVFAPEGSLVFHEKAWNAYPYCRTIVTNEYMKDNFFIKIETWHKPDLGTQENVHKLDRSTWQNVAVVPIDIADRSEVSAADYKPDEDPAKFKSAKTGRGPLGPAWKRNFVRSCVAFPSKPSVPRSLTKGPAHCGSTECFYSAAEPSKFTVGNFSLLQEVKNKGTQTALKTSAVLSAFRGHKGMPVGNGVAVRAEAEKWSLHLEFIHFALPPPPSSKELVSKTDRPRMCAYKLVTVKFKWWGLQTKVENLIHEQEKRIFNNFHRQLFCWIDKWVELNMADIRRMEAETQNELDELRRRGEVRGTSAADD
ncbi:Phosphatidylinositol transfer protein beta isoform [Dissostichus eleginoides]|uniref:Phosphatidylinositol transfer protein beta isoform n=1 Tax=Dissostichus eleginoides TaxID=100907 RepID=A0AAD9C295_DISEL|nr:Phosphatidylinositol transfer protein beta isoform [Dissostichus eleginoides]